MPLYDLKCDCGKTRSTYRKIAARDDLPLCSCGGKFQRVISAPMLQASFTEYRSPATGRLITSRAAERDETRRTNMLIKEPGLDRDIAKRKVEAIEESFKPLDDSVDSAVRNLVNDGKVSV